MSNILRNSVCYSLKLLNKEEQLAPCPTIYYYLAVRKTISYFTGHTIRPQITLCLRFGEQNQTTLIIFLPPNYREAPMKYCYHICHVYVQLVTLVPGNDTLDCPKYYIDTPYV